MSLNHVVEYYKNKKTSNFKSKFPDEYNKVQELTSFLPSDASSTQRLWHIKNDCFERVKCAECDKHVRWYAKYGGYAKFCSPKCSNNSLDKKQQIKSTNLDKYGVDSYSKTDEFKNYVNGAEFKAIMQSEEVKDKRSKTCQQRYGSDNYLSSKVGRKKIKETFIKNYGVDNPFKSGEIKKSIMEKNRELYGTDTPFESLEIRNKAKERMKDVYNVEHGLQLKDIHDKTKQSYKEKTGYDTPFQNPEVKEKIQLKFDEKYGCHPTLKNYSKKTLKLITDKDWLIRKHHDESMTLTEISEKYLEGYDVSSLSKRMQEFGIEIKKLGISSQEQELRTFINDVYSGNAIYNDRALLCGKEVDIVLPDIKLCIEYCGIYWHSEAINSNKHSHKEKYLKLKKLGYRLITIFENEWIHKQSIVTSKLKHILGVSTTPAIGGRECTISEVNNTEAKKFYDMNHIQGHRHSSIHLGLYYNEKLVACMSFSRVAKMNRAYYLNRFCSENVRGGFGKLLKCFEKKYEPSAIITFSDNRWDTGNIYSKMGFDLEKEMPVDYQYVILKNSNVYHKFNFRHVQLEKMLDNYDPNLTERQNCWNNNIYRIWDCGKKKWIKNYPVGS